MRRFQHSFVALTLLAALAVVVLAAPDGGGAGGDLRSSAHRTTTSSTCTSPVTRSSVLPCRPTPEEWSEAAMLVPHEAIRVLLARFVAAVESEGLDRRWSVQHASLLQGWFASRFVPFVRHHQTSTQTTYVPWMEQCLAARGEVLPQLRRATYDHTVQAIDAVSSVLEHASADAGNAVTKDGSASVGGTYWVAKLRGVVRAMATALEENMQEEEEQYVPLLRTFCSQREEERVAQQMIQELGFFGHKVMLPAVVEALGEWASPATLQQYLNRDAIPPPIRWLLKHVWTRDHELNSKLSLALMERRQLPIVRPVPWLYAHAEMVALSALCVLLVATAFAAFRAPSVTNPRQNRRVASRKKRQ